MRESGASIGGMAVLYDAELRPSKLELIESWLPIQEWYDGPTPPGLERVASYRFDDPEGEVGIETHLVRAADGRVYQVPLTYRGAPLDGAEQWLAGTMEHSVLGKRWVYDAVGDPVYRSIVTSVIGSGGKEADQFVRTDDGLTPIPNTAHVFGHGPSGGSGSVEVLRRPTSGAPVPAGARLDGRWMDLSDSVALVVLVDRSTRSSMVE